jgi:hypothetical protein
MVAGGLGTGVEELIRKINTEGEADRLLAAFTLDGTSEMGNVFR